MPDSPVTIEGIYDPTPHQTYMALLDSVRDYPGQHVDRTIAIWRMRERLGWTWADIGERFTLSAERARQIAKSYSPGNYCAEMVPAVAEPFASSSALRQCGQPTVHTFDLLINGMTGKMGLCAAHLHELAHRWDAAPSVDTLDVTLYVRQLAYSTPYTSDELRVPVGLAMSLGIPTAQIEKLLKMGTGFLKAVTELVMSERVKA